MKREPIKCEICEKEFIPKPNQRFCGKVCAREGARRTASKKKYSRGEIWVLDMESWTWTKEDRGD